MKRILCLFAALCLLFLSACTADKGDPNVYDVEYKGKLYSVDQINRTIAVDGYTCEFDITYGGRFVVTYPDGSTYSADSDIGWGGSHSENFDPEQYVTGDTLWEVLEQDRPGAKQTSNHAGLGILLVLFGVLEAAFPQASWWLSHGWRFKNAEPSDLALGLGRTVGVIMILIGIICFFV